MMTDDEAKKLMKEHEMDLLQGANSREVCLAATPSTK